MTAELPDPTPERVALTQAATALLTDIGSSVKGPTLAAHAGTFVLDVALVAGLVPVWLDQPLAVDLVSSAIAGLLSVGARLYAWYQASETARRHQAALAAAVVGAGRHAAP